MFRSILVAIAIGSAIQAMAHAQTYPERTVKIIVPFVPGGSTDVTARILAEGLTKTFNQQVIVENKPGASGTVGIDAVAKSRPDGYTLGLSGVGPTAIIPMIDPNLPYNPARDLDVVAGLSTVDLMLVTRPDFAHTTLAAVIEFARKNPEKVTYASTGVAGPVHLQTENLTSLAGVKMLHVPYSGDAQVITALLSGQVDIAYLTVAGGLAMVQSGKLKAIAAGGPKRIQSLPDLPTVAELTGFKDYDAYTWNVLVAAKGTPRPVLDALNRATNEVMSNPDVKARFDTLGLLTMAGDVKSAQDFVASEIAKYKAIIARTGVKRE